MRYAIEVKDRSNCSLCRSHICNEDLSIRDAIAERPPKTIRPWRHEVHWLLQMHVEAQAVIRVGNCFLGAHRHRSIMIEDFQTAFLESVHIPDPIGNIKPVILVPIDRNRWNRQSRAVFIVEGYL